MPSFCRHNRLIQNCSICAREQDVELRPLVSPSAPSSGGGRQDGAARSTGTGQGRGSGATDRARAGDGVARRRAPRTGSSGTRALRVRRIPRGGDDGYRSPLVPGLKSRVEAERLAQEIAFSAHRLARLETEPPGLYAEVADPHGDLEERSWLAFQIAYLSPLEHDDPFSALRSVRTSWSSGAVPELDTVPTGPRSTHVSSGDARALVAYRAWAGRAGSQTAAFTGDVGWTAERRFARAFERLALPGLNRDARFDLLLTLGSLGLYELRPDTLALSGENSATLAAKRTFGIGDPLLLDRRARELAAAGSIPLGALDLALHNFEAPARATLGLAPEDGTDEATLAATRAALGL